MFKGLNSAKSSLKLILGNRTLQGNSSKWNLGVESSSSVKLPLRSFSQVFFKKVSVTITVIYSALTVIYCRLNRTSKMYKLVLSFFCSFIKA